MVSQGYCASTAATSLPRSSPVEIGNRTDGKAGARLAMHWPRRAIEADKGQLDLSISCNDDAMRELVKKDKLRYHRGMLPWLR